MERKELIELWVAALRSGNYKQGLGQLRSFNDEYCCLGVLCEVYQQNIGGLEIRVEEVTDFRGDDEALVVIDRFYRYNECATALPDPVMEAVGIKTPYASFETDNEKASLANLNDHSWTFEQIANLIEEDPDWLSTEE